MCAKHPDRTDEWRRQQEALKYPKTFNNPSPGDTGKQKHK